MMAEEQNIRTRTIIEYRHDCPYCGVEYWTQLEIDEMCDTCYEVRVTREAAINEAELWGRQGRPHS